MISKLLSLNLPYTLKNNKAVCELLERDYKDSTDSKRATEKILSQYCEWHKQGHKYIITSIFTEPKQKEDGRKNNAGGNINNKFGELLDGMILFEIYTHHRMFETLSFLRLLFFNVTDRFYDIPYRAKQICDSHYNYPIWYAYDFYNVIRVSMNAAIKSSFKRLEAKGLITVNKITYIAPVKGKHREATEKEIAEYKDIQQEILNELGFANESMCVFRGKYPEYKEELSAELNNRDILTYYDKYDVWRANPTGTELIDALWIYEPEQFERVRKDVNQELCNSVIENAIKRKRKSADKLTAQFFDEDAPDVTYSDQMRASVINDYVDLYKYMVDEYVRADNSTDGDIYAKP